MSVVKSYFYLTKLRCRAVPASLSRVSVSPRRHIFRTARSSFTF